MTLNYISLALALLQAALDAAIKNQAAASVIADLQAAIAKITAVHNTDVTWAQLDGLRADKEWPDAPPAAPAPAPEAPEPPAGDEASK